MKAVEIPVVSGAHPTYGHLLEWKKDPIQLFTRAVQEKNADIYHFKFGTHSFYLVNRPSYVEQILFKQMDRFVKPDLEEWRQVMGNGLVTAEGEQWKRQRRFLQPLFNPAHLRHYGGQIQETLQQWLPRWQQQKKVKLLAEMSDLTIAISLKIFFGFTEDVETERILAIVEVFNRYTYESKQTSAKRSEDEFQAAVKEMEKIVQNVIQSAEKGVEERNDLLSMLVKQKKEDERHFTDQQIYDEVVTHLIAGYETTATALTWALYHLMTNPDCLAKMKEEIAEKVGDRSISIDHLTKLPYTQAVINETLRRTPVVWLIARKSVQSFQLEEMQFPENTYVYLSPAVLHQNPFYFSNPDEFSPERWLDGLDRRLPPYAYLPFGGGPRLCIGRNLFLLEATLILCELLQQVDFTLAPQQEIVPTAGVTYYPKNDIEVTIMPQEKLRA
nr:McmI [Thermoactinomyces sp.]